jgi:hypothetical protein
MHGNQRCQHVDRALDGDVDKTAVAVRPPEPVGCLRFDELVYRGVSRKKCCGAISIGHDGLGQRLIAIQPVVDGRGIEQIGAVVAIHAQTVCRLD